MDMAYSLRYWFSLESSLFLLSLSFLDMATPFFLSFLLSFFLGHASSAYHLFSFWGNHNLTLFYFRNVLQERLSKHGAFIDGEWMDGGANS